jgi:uncharacterized protein YodC (DUF2158 family)
MEKGKVVYLKSGSPAMTVGYNSSAGWKCQWFVGTELKEGYFDTEQLTETKPEVSQIAIVPNDPSGQRY